MVKIKLVPMMICLGVICHQVSQSECIRVFVRSDNPGLERSDNPGLVPSGYSALLRSEKLGSVRAEIRGRVHSQDPGLERTSTFQLVEQEEDEKEKELASDNLPQSILQSPALWKVVSSSLKAAAKKGIYASSRASLRSHSGSLDADSSSGVGCSLDISRLPRFHPWILHPRTGKILYPTSGSNIELSHGENMMLICSDSHTNERNYFRNTKRTSVVISKCSNGIFEYKGHTLNNADYRCDSMPFTIMRNTRKRCYNDLAIYAVGFWIRKFLIKTSFTTVYELCVDDRNPELIKAKYAIHKIQRAIQYQQDLQTIYFQPWPMYIPRDNEEDYYTTPKFKHVYLARNEDFVYRSERLSTFMVGNSAPQYDRGYFDNYGMMERDVKDLAVASGPITVYTGTSGVLKFGDLPEELNHTKTDDVKITGNPFSEESTNTVPSVFWKVIFNEHLTRSVALLFHNQGNKNEVKKWCQDVTHQASWLKGWQDGKNNDPSMGVSYTCEVSKFLAKVEYLLPQFLEENINFLH